MRIVYIRFFLLVATLLFSGCVAPLPTIPHYTGDSRQNIDAKSKEKVVPGKTSVEDIILQFGEPDVVSPDESKLLYGIEKNIGYLLWAVPYSAAGALPVEQDYYLIVNIDKNGLVTAVEFKIDDWNWNLPEDLKPKSPNIPPNRNYRRIYPKIPLPQEIDSALVTVTDNRPNPKFHFGLILIPSETELVRRILVQKLTDLQKQYGIESQKKYFVELDAFTIKNKLSANLISSYYAVSIKSILKCDNNEISLSAYYKKKAPFWSAKEQAETITTAIELALDNMKNNLERKAPLIFNNHD